MRMLTFLRRFYSLRGSVGLLIVGGLCWVVYLSYVNILTVIFGVPHLASEASGIVISHLLYYFSNTYLVFKQRPSWRAFITSVLVSGIGWLAYLGTTTLMTDVFGQFSTWGTLAGIPVKYCINIVFQQFFTFGLAAGRQVKTVPGTAWWSRVLRATDRFKPRAGGDRP